MKHVHFYIFRHGETDWNAQERFQGHLDIPLNDTGRRQARELGQKLRDLGLEALLASDLSRSIETAEIVARELGLAPGQLHQHAGIKEAFLGEAQGLTVEEIRQRFGPEVMGRWRSNQVTDADISYPGGETGKQVLERALATLESFAQANPSFRKVGVSSHGGVIRRIVHHLMGDPTQHVPIPNGIVYEIHFEREKGLWKLKR